MPIYNAYAYIVFTCILTSCGIRTISPQSEIKVIRAIKPVSLTNGIPAWNAEIERNAAAAGQIKQGGNYTECAATIEIRGGFLCASYSPYTMNNAMARASLFVEGDLGVPRGKVIAQNDPIMARAVASIGGHDIPSDDLLKFWAASNELCASHGREPNSCANPAEKEFFENFVIPLSRATPNFVVISYAVKSRSSYLDVVTHEAMHAQYFLQPLYRQVCDRFWAESVSPEDKQAAKSLLASTYDIKNDLLIKNEFQAYILMAGADHFHLQSLVGKYRANLVAKLAAVGVRPVQVGGNSQVRHLQDDSATAYVPWNSEGCYQTYSAPDVKSSIICVAGIPAHQTAESEATAVVVDTNGQPIWCGFTTSTEVSSNQYLLNFKGSKSIRFSVTKRSPGSEGTVDVNSAGAIAFKEIPTDEAEKIEEAIRNSDICK